MSDSPGLVDFAIELVNFELNLPDGQVNMAEESTSCKNALLVVVPEQHSRAHVS